MPINDDNVMKERERCRRMADRGNLACKCGNENWEQFLYVSAGEQQLAGCKVCGAVYEYKAGDSLDSFWVFLRGSLLP